MNLENLYQLTISHKKSHSCSAPPYDNYLRLYEIVKSLKPSRILEIGTGIGFTSIVMANASPGSTIETIEKDKDHVAGARDFIKSHMPSNSINVISGIAELELVELSGPYDLIFFDGFQIHHEFLEQYERLLLKNGILVLGNNHLGSKTSDQFFIEFATNGKWEIIDKFAETIVAKRL